VNESQFEGSSGSYVSSHVMNTHTWKPEKSREKVTLASTSHSSSTEGHIFVTLSYNGITYDRVKLSILPNLCADVLLGHDFLSQHQTVQIPFNGHKPPFTVCGVAAAIIEPPPLFEHLTPHYRPVATKSRRYNSDDEAFIGKEIKSLLDDGVIETSRSPWRAQVLVVQNGIHKRRLVVDYSQTINRFTLLDAYPLPKIEPLIAKIAEFTVYSALDLKSAYHQVPIREDEKKFTAFEACGQLYQFRRIPFGVTNGVAAFQRVIDNIIKSENMHNTYAYVDNVTICGRTIDEHNTNLNRFLAAADKYGLTLNHDKSIIATTKINLLGYKLSHGLIKPDPERLQPLRELQPPDNLKSQTRVVGLFSYYSHWIPNFSDKIHALVHNQIFPLHAKVTKQ
jgi:hypothetical protein